MREVGQEFFCEPSLAAHLTRTHTPMLERIQPGVTPAHAQWRPGVGRMLRAHLGIPAAQRVVACVNIWQDRPALERCLPSWFQYVDAVDVLDGAYGGGASDDGLDEYLAELREAVPGKEIILRVLEDATQLDKRTALLLAGRPGDIRFIVDADEHAEDARLLRTLPELDVGWVDITSPLYARPYGQPRLIRWQPGLRYSGRHHWLWAGPRLLTTHQYGGLALHATTGIRLENRRGLGHSPWRSGVKRSLHRSQYKVEVAAVALPGRSEASDGAAGGRESLRILQLTHYDPGMVAYRLHTGINCTTPHASLLGSAAARNTFKALMQYDIEADAPQLRAALHEADVVHCHLDYGVLRGLLGGPEPELGRFAHDTGRMLVIHHHGTLLRKMAAFYAHRDRELDALRLISNLELTKYGERLHWLPNPVPCREYQELHARVWEPSERFRVAHSPSKRHLKGTEEFLVACDRLNAAGFPVEPVLIEGMGHREALALKATCDAAFDSFWLGIQCSGLEAAAMGLPVIAGDPYVAAQYRELVGGVPYTYANDATELEAALRRMMEEPDFRLEEALRVGSYVQHYHDEAAVALRYLDLLDEYAGWRSRLSIARQAPATVALQTPAVPAIERREHFVPQEVVR